MSSSFSGGGPAIAALRRSAATGEESETKHREGDGRPGNQGDEGERSPGNLYKLDRLGETQVLPGPLVLENLYDQIKQANENRFNYISLCSFLAYSLLYIVVVMMQRRSTDAFMVEESLKNAMFSEATNTVENSSGEIAQNMDSFAHILSWFSTNFVDSVFTDPVCGNGVCDAPLEFRQWESYGCADDCGTYPSSKLTEIVVELSADFDSDTEAAQASWNLCSNTHDLCLHKIPEVFVTANQSIARTVKVPDGEWEVRLVAFYGGISGRVYREVVRENGTDVHELVSLSKCKTAVSNEKMQQMDAVVQTCLAETGIVITPCGSGDSCGACTSSESCTQQSDCKWSPEPRNECFQNVCSSQGSGLGCTVCPDELSCTSAGCVFESGAKHPCHAEPSAVPTSSCAQECSACTYEECTDQVQCTWDGDSYSPGGMTCVPTDGKGRGRRQRQRQLKTRKLSHGNSAGPCTTCAGCDGNPDDCENTNGCIFDYGQYLCDGTPTIETKPITSRCQEASAGECLQDFLDDTEVCDLYCNIPECDYDRGACTDTADLYETLCSASCYCSMLGNGICDPACNNVNCASDVGDCCEPSFEGSASLSFQVYESSTPETVQRLTPDPDIPRKRYVGTQNRLIGGILLNQQRHARAPCASSGDRYGHISDLCSTGTMSAAPFGFDAVFLKNSPLNVDAAVFQAKHKYYNLSNPEEVNSLNVPFGFHFRADAGVDGGFPVFFDVKLNNEEAKRFADLLEHGHYLDANTAQVDVQFVTYNAEVKLFADVHLVLGFEKGGRITLSNTVQTFETELYDQGYLRPILEVVFFIITLINVGFEWREFLTLWRQTRRFQTYFRSVWNYIDLLNIGLLLYNCMVWLTVYTKLANDFSPEERYDVYSDLGADGRFLALQDNGTQMGKVLAFFKQSGAMASSLALYMAGSAVSMVLLVLRVLKMLDFQKRMGLVTRTLANASSDLAHFMILFGIIFCVYASLAHIIFGSSIIGFSTFPRAVNTCFSILLGEIGVQEELFMHQSKFAAAVYYFTFIFVCCFLLLNVFLAIIVDAYVEVKKSAQESLTLPAELWQTINAYRKTFPGFRLQEPAFMSDEEILATAKEAISQTKIMKQKSKIGRRLVQIEGFTANQEELSQVIAHQFRRYQAMVPEFQQLAEKIAVNDDSSILEKGAAKNVEQGARRDSEAMKLLKAYWSNPVETTLDTVSSSNFSMDTFAEHLAANIIHRYGAGDERFATKNNQSVAAHKVVPAPEADAAPLVGKP